MELSLDRLAAAGKARPGDLFIAGTRYCCTLENDALRIRAGRYRVVLTPSARAIERQLWTPDKATFRLPLLEHVDRTGIRMHAANEYYQLEGCIATGKTWSGAWLGSSQAAFTPLFAQLLEAEARHEETWIAITEPTDMS